MNQTLREAFSIRQIVAALLVSAGWLAVAIMERYPVEYWVGVVVICYIVWRVLNEAVFHISQFWLRKILAHIQSMYNRGGMEPPGGDGSRLARLIGLAYIYALGMIIGGSTILITPKVIEVVELPPLGINSYIGLIAVSIGGLFVLSFFGFALIRLILLSRSVDGSHIISQAVVVSDGKLAQSNFPVLAGP